MTVLLGAIADDFTGATGLCNTLVRRGMLHARLLYARLFGPARRAGTTHRDKIASSPAAPRNDSPELPLRAQRSNLAVTGNL